MVPRLNANLGRLNVKSAKTVLSPLSRLLDLYTMAKVKAETWVTLSRERRQHLQCGEELIPDWESSLSSPVSSLLHMNNKDYFCCLNAFECSNLHPLNRYYHRNPQAFLGKHEHYSALSLLLLGVNDHNLDGGKAL